MHIKKIIGCLLLVGVISALPLRLLNLSTFNFEILALIKGLLVICLLYIFIKKENLQVKLFGIDSASIGKNTIPALFLLVLYLSLNYKKLLFFSPYSNTVLLIALTAFVFAFAEEIIFRGYVYGHLIKIVSFKYQAILNSSALFALMHCLNIYKFDDIFGLINQLVFAFFMGILLGSLFFITKSLLFTSLYHFFINLPVALNRLQDRNVTKQEVLSQSLSDNLIGSLLFILVISPIIIISIYYLVRIRKYERGGDTISNGY